MKRKVSIPDVAIIPKNILGIIYSFGYKMLVVATLLIFVVLLVGFSLPDREVVKYGYGADIMVVLDLSDSMDMKFSKDRSVSRIDVVKNMVADIIEQKKEGRADRYGLIGFGQSSLIMVPLTFNHQFFLNSLRAQKASLWGSNTHYAFMDALNELSKSSARSRVIVFVSDGGVYVGDEKYNFSGFMFQHGIKLHWVGIDIDSRGASFFLDFFDKLGPLGYSVEVSNTSDLVRAFDEIYDMEKSLISYKERDPILSDNLCLWMLGFLSILFLMSVFVVGRRKDV